jgi:hypothetical protein
MLELEPVLELELLVPLALILLEQLLELELEPVLEELLEPELELEPSLTLPRPLVLLPLELLQELLEPPHMLVLEVRRITETMV